MNLPRRNTRQIMVGSVAIGGGAPVSIQTMTNTAIGDTAVTLAQIERSARLGARLVRLAVDDEAQALAFGRLVQESPVPLIADIQFELAAALAAIRNGAAAVRINPGIIADDSKLAELAGAAVEHGVPIRVGANSGSLRPARLAAKRVAGLSHDEAVAEELCDNALRQCEALERLGVRAIKVALKSSSVPATVAACRRFAARTDYPLHLGVTEAGTPAAGVVKSAVGIGALLLDGIGDTIRVSLTAPPEEEVIAARRILESCRLMEASPEIVSCPTCGRTEIDLVGLAGRVERLIAEVKSSGRTIALRKIAVMGCPVNGPGEARDADLGIAGSRSGRVVIFRSGEVVGAYDAEAGWECFRQELLKNTR